jgi:uncharacterized protein (TIGR00297 family)
MHLSQHDLFTGLIAIVLIAFVLVLIELFTKHNLLSKLLGRKLLHFTAICTCAWAISRFENRQLLSILFILFFFILLWVISKGWMQVNDYKTYGIALFPLSFALLLFSPIFSLPVIVYAVLILGISDAAAGIIGEYFGKKKIIFLSENKSWAGFAAFYFTAFFVSLFYFKLFSVNGILLCGILALLPAVTELFSYKGSDNFTVPIFTALWAVIILKLESNELAELLLPVSFFLLLALLATYKRWLTVSGATAAFWIALLLYASGEYKAFITPGIFLICGSLLSKLNNHASEKEGRNAKQVFANGIPGTVFMILYDVMNQKIYLIAAIISFCISMADSASSEVGVYFKKSTYDILSFKKITFGLSGGVSVPGTLAALVGAMAISFAAVITYNFSTMEFLIITCAGFAGMLADSVLGSSLQVKYKLRDEKISETIMAGAIKIKGYSWCENNMVNLLSNLIITLLFFFIVRQTS